MANRLKFVPKLSLEELALRRVVVDLWNKDDILALIPRFQTDEEESFQHQRGRYDAIWRRVVENMVRDKVASLALPETLKRRLLLAVAPIGLQLKEWYVSMEAYIDHSKKYLEHLCWTSAGAINYQKTTEKLVQLKTLGVLKRFKAACFYYLADSIPTIWGDLPEHYKSYLCDETDIYAVDVSKAEIYWAYVMKEEESELDGIFRSCFRSGISTFNQHAFEISARDGNRAATEYFFQRLTYEERDKLLVKSVCDVAVILSDKVVRFGRSKALERHLSDVLCFLLSVMSTEQQMRAFTNNRLEILNCFRDWPVQDFFFDIADVTFSQEI